MSMPRSQINNGSALILKTDFFNDNEFVINSMQTESTDDVIIIDISDKSNADFTDTDWDQILNSILSSSKIITT